MLSPLISTYDILTSDGTQLSVETTPQSWSGNIGLQTFDSLGAGEPTRADPRTSSKGWRKSSAP